MLHRPIARTAASLPRFAARTSPPTPFFRPNVLRSYTTATRTPPSRPFKTISASIALTSASLMYFYANKDNVAHAESSMPPPISAFSTASPSSVLAELLDENNRSFLQAKSTEELLLAMFVYKMCTFPWLVDAAPKLISLAESLHMEKVAYWFVRSSFFEYFCGGETAEECIRVMDKLMRSGINSILDLSVEADENVQQDFASQEKVCDFNMKMMKVAIETAGQGQQASSSTPLVAVKVTGLTPPELLLRLNQAITALDKAFHEHQHEGKVSVDSLRKIADQIFPPAEEEQRRERDALLSKLDHSVDFIEYTNLFNVNSPIRDTWYSHGNLLTQDDLAAYDRMMGRLDEICSLAKNIKAGIMIDAEQTYFQEAIDHVAVNMEAKYNRRDGEQAPTVYNTYQMYTKASLRKLQIDVERAHRENFAFAAKLVRGAYMVSERKRALEMGYPSPIHDTIEDTHASYNGGVRFLLSKLHEHQEATGEPLAGATAPIVFMVASHNRESVILTIQEMEKHGVLPRSGVVHFGQLYGMQDQISYALGKNGYSIYKYLPYGLIQDVVPYLIRRAQENSSVLGGVTKERQLILQEFKDRVTGKAAKPVIQSAPAVVVTPAAAVAESAPDASSVAETA
ncbi:FAD-linked oxidoreductase-like protein [Fennellomyces sp. T-0311]|nr:FAD-linked oxidoreductase-like protein [Fennellomyces sp. T-0311]